jgi:beta-glucosidase
LSYTTFSYGKPQLVGAKEFTGDGTATITVDVTNTGNRAGAEVVQLYIADVKAPVARPAKELKAFKKVMLAPGETKTVTFTISASDLAYFDADAHAWTSHAGQYKAYVGSSSALANLAAVVFSYK